MCLAGPEEDFDTATYIKNLNIFDQFQRPLVLSSRTPVIVI